MIHGDTSVNIYDGALRAHDRKAFHVFCHKLIFFSAHSLSPHWLTHCMKILYCFFASIRQKVPTLLCISIHPFMGSYSLRSVLLLPSQMASRLWLYPDFVQFALQFPCSAADIHFLLQSFDMKEKILRYNIIYIYALCMLRLQTVVKSICQCSSHEHTLCFLRADRPSGQQLS